MAQALNKKIKEQKVLIKISRKRECINKTSVYYDFSFIVIFIHVMNKRRQLGILKAIGVRGSMIIGSYVFQTIFYSLLGIIVGLAIIYGVADTYFNRHPLDMGFAKVSLLVNVSSAFQGVLLIMLAGLVAGLIPAWFTVRQSIIKAIWGS